MMKTSKQVFQSLLADAPKHCPHRACMHAASNVTSCVAESLSDQCQTACRHGFHSFAQSLSPALQMLVASSTHFTLALYRCVSSLLPIGKAFFPAPFLHHRSWATLCPLAPPFSLEELWAAWWLLQVHGEPFANRQSLVSFPFQKQWATWCL